MGRTGVCLCLAFCEVCRGRIWINACVAAGDDEFDIPALKRYLIRDWREVRRGEIRGRCRSKTGWLMHRNQGTDDAYLQKKVAVG